MQLLEILKIYDEENKKKIGLEDIYLYLYHLNLNNNEKGKYSEKFKLLYKSKNYKSKKLEFRKKCKKYMINKEGILLKKIKAKNIVLNQQEIIYKTIIPPKYENLTLKFYNFNNGHKGYFF